MKKSSSAVHPVCLKRTLISNAVLCAFGLALSHGVNAETITKTETFEYNPVTGSLQAHVREPDDVQLHLRTEFTYDQFGNRLTTHVSSTATGLGAIPARTTETTVWSGGATPQSSTNAVGHRTDGSFDAFKSPLFIQNVNGVKTLWQYDGFGRKTLETRPDGNKTKFAYDLITPFAVGTGTAKFLVTTTPVGADNQTNGPWTKTYYDGLRRVIRTETLGFDGVAVIRLDTEYDALGRTARTSRPYYVNAAAQWTTFAYDGMGRLVLTTAPDGSQTSMEYNGLTTIATNALGQTQTTVKNNQGQIAKVIDTLGNELTYSYDANGNVTKTVDPKGNTIVATFDKLGRKKSMIDPDLGSFTYEYDVLGQLQKQTDAKSQVTTMTYDLIGRSKNRTEPDLVSTWTYDTCTMGKGRLCRVSADNGYAADYSFDSLARPFKTVTTIDAAYTSSITYGTNGKVGTQVYPTGLAVKFVYTSLGYLKEVRNNATDALYWQANSVNAAGQFLQQTYGNNLVTQQVFEPSTGRVKNIYAGAGNAVQNMSFTYDPRGNMLTRNDANQSLAETFLYDDLNRLTSNTVNSSGAGLVTQSYTYDSIGNIKTRSDVGGYGYDSVGKGPHAVGLIDLVGGGKREYTYDANGNLTQEVERDSSGAIIAAKGRTETYTSFNMPVTLSSPGTTLSFVYGVDHQRIKQISPGGTTIYVHPDNVGGLSYEKEIKANGSIEHKHYIAGGDGVVALVKQATAGTTVRYFHRDQLGSTTAVTNEAGAVVERMAYEPFGKRRTPAGALDLNGSIDGIETDRGFTNHEHLDELNLIHMNGRVYDPSIGRFISADPNVPHPTNIQSYNRYSYVRNNPLIHIDPSGFREEEVREGEGWAAFMSFNKWASDLFNQFNTSANWIYDRDVTPNITAYYERLADRGDAAITAEAMDVWNAAVNDAVVTTYTRDVSCSNADGSLICRPMDGWDRVAQGGLGIARTVTGTLSVATGATLCYTTALGCLPGTVMLTVGISEVTQGANATRDAWNGIESAGYNPLLNTLLRYSPDHGDTIYYGGALLGGVGGLRASVPLVMQSSYRTTSIFGTTVPLWNNSTLIRGTSIVLSPATSQGISTTSTVIGGYKVVNSLGEECHPGFRCE